MQTQRFLTRFKIQYLIAAGMIVLELACAFGLIQYALWQARVLRTESATLDKQRARELYYADAAKSIAIDPAHRLQYALSLQQNHSLDQWIATEATLTSDDPQIAADFRVACPHYLLLKQAYLSLLAAERGPTPGDIHPQLITIIAHDSPYVFAMYDAYRRLDAIADDAFVGAQRIEAILFLLSFATILYEALAAIRPAIHDLTRDLHTQGWRTTPPPPQEEKHGNIAEFPAL